MRIKSGAAPLLVRRWGSFYARKDVYETLPHIDDILLAKAVIFSLDTPKKRKITI